MIVCDIKQHLNANSVRRIHTRNCTYTCFCAINRQQCVNYLINLITPHDQESCCRQYYYLCRFCLLWKTYPEKVLNYYVKKQCISSKHSQLKVAYPYVKMTKYVFFVYVQFTSSIPSYDIFLIYNLLNFNLTDIASTVSLPSFSSLLFFFLITGFLFIFLSLTTHQVSLAPSGGCCNSEGRDIAYAASQYLARMKLRRSSLWGKDTRAKRLIQQNRWQV